MAHWLMKSEPDVFSIDDLEARGVEPWTGVRNYLARNHMRSMAVGDEILFYHSNAKPSGIAGIARVTKTAFPDPSQFEVGGEYFDPKATLANPRWFCVEVGFVARMARFLSLEELKARTDLVGFPLLLPGQRLSVMPVEDRHAAVLRSLGTRL